MYIYICGIYKDYKRNIHKYSYYKNKLAEKKNTDPIGRPPKAAAPLGVPPKAAPPTVSLSINSIII